MSQLTDKEPGLVIAENVAVVVVPTGNTELLELPTLDLSTVGIEINPTVNALDAFIVQGRMSPEGAYQTISSAPGDYTTPNAPVIRASGNLTVLGAGALGWLLYNVLMFYSIKIFASANAAGNSVVTIRAIGK